MKARYTIAYVLYSNSERPTPKQTEKRSTVGLAHDRLSWCQRHSFANL